MTVVDAVVERFAHHSPMTLMARLALQRTLDPNWIDEVFARHAQHQYVRELLFSTTVELMSLRPVRGVAGLSWPDTWHRCSMALALELGQEVTDALCPVCRLTGELQRGLEQAVNVPASCLRAVPCGLQGPLRERKHMRTGKDRVLVVDDYRDAADTLVELLHVHDIEAYACYSAEEGFALATRIQPTVVIIEPAALGKVLNGMQLAAMLRHGDAATRPLLVALTGWGRQQDIAAAVQGGFDAFLLKPSCWADLVGLIRPGAGQQGRW